MMGGLVAPYQRRPFLQQRDQVGGSSEDHHQLRSEAGA